MRVSFGQLDIECKGYGEITPQSGWFIGPHAHEYYEVHCGIRRRSHSLHARGTVEGVAGGDQHGRDMKDVRPICDGEVNTA